MSEKMRTEWRTLERGIRCYDHCKRKHGIKADRYFSLRFKIGGKSYEEGLGWSSQGWTLSKARETLAELRIARKKGEGAITLKERRDEAKAQREEKQVKNSLTLQSVFYGGYLTVTRSEGKRESTIQAEQGLMKNYIEPFFGTISLYALDGDNVASFMEHLRNIKSKKTGRPLSNQTIKHALNLISQIFNYVRMRKRIVIENPIQYIKKPSTATAERERFLTRDEARLLLKALARRSMDTHDMVLLALFCGLRAGEILSLTWGCVSFRDKTLLLKDTKNKSNRHAYMTPEVEKMLKSRDKGQRLDTRVFANAEISHSFERTVEELGLNEGRSDARERVVFHTCRHTFASWHARKGTPLYTISKLLGHKSLDMTMRYAHLCPNAEKEAAMLLSGELD